MTRKINILPLFALWHVLCITSYAQNNGDDRHDHGHHHHRPEMGSEPNPSQIGDTAAYQFPTLPGWVTPKSEFIGGLYLAVLSGLAMLILIHNIARRIVIYAAKKGPKSRPAKGQRRVNYLKVWWKLHFLYAPLFSHRRSAEVHVNIGPRLKLNFGTIPSRLQAIFITSLVAANVFMCSWDIPWSSPALEVLPMIRARTGTLSVVNFVPIVLLASIQNPLINSLSISYDTFNLFHRWFGRIAIAQALAHTLCYLIAGVKSSNWSEVGQALQQPVIYTGLAGTIAAVIIFVQASKVIRSFAYETFRYLHFALALILLIFVWIHLEGLPPQFFVLIAGVLWAAARVARLATILYRNIGWKKSTKVRMMSQDGDVVRVTINPPRHMRVKPGQSVYLRVPSLGWMGNHPFSIAWQDDIESQGSRLHQASTKSAVEVYTESTRLEKSGPQAREPMKQNLQLLIKKHKGFTARLSTYTSRRVHTDDRAVCAIVDGPYGVAHDISRYENVMLFASGVGITHQMLYLKKLVEVLDDPCIATQSVTLIWIMPHINCLQWTQHWMHNITDKASVLKGRVNIECYITRPTATDHMWSPGKIMSLSSGRPDIQNLVFTEAQKRAGRLCVTVCAAGPVADDVREAARQLLRRDLDVSYFEEGFGW